MSPLKNKIRKGFNEKQLNQLKILFEDSKAYTDKQNKKLIRLIHKVKNELQQNIATLAIHSPTRKEFEDLKNKVDLHHPNL